jgi:hypothetical protein
MRDNVLFKFTRPNNTPGRKPSRTLTDALRRLSETDELRQLRSDALNRDQRLEVHIYHSADGRPILIHFGTIKTD